VTGFSDDGLQVLQRGIQRLLGQCLLRVQTYERLIKDVVAHHNISGAVQSLDKAQAARADDISRKTLGAVVNQLLETFLTTEKNAMSVEASHAPSDTRPEVTIRMQLGFSTADFARTENGLRELVILRNNLVHHFLAQHDLGSFNGCRGAQDALITASDRIEQHFDDLCAWAEDLKRMSLRAAEIIRSDAVHGAIPWPTTEIVMALREAATELSLDGWASVKRAGEWVSARYPAALPKNYGCRSWWQVLHGSGGFELRHRQTDGQSAAWYRAKSRDVTSK